MITIIEGDMIGRVAGIALMAAAFCWLVYVMVVVGWIGWCVAGDGCVLFGAGVFFGRWAGMRKFVRVGFGKIL